MKKILFALLMLTALVLSGCSNSALIEECVDCCNNNENMDPNYCFEFCETHINDGLKSERQSFVDMVCSNS
jgi:PBP1b-binding outer membrane lipoprotein LpoB